LMIGMQSKWGEDLCDELLSHKEDT
jgi:hypothetical protein